VTIATGPLGPVIYSVFPRNHASGGFAAVEDDLPRIRSLGVDYIWLMPFYPIGRKNRKGSLGSPYAIRDHRAVDPELGTVADFCRLVDSVHAHGMRAMIDLVFNHVAPDSVIATDHPEWLWTDESGSPGPRVRDWTDVWDLDYRNRALCDFQVESMAFWLGNGVDGFRCDVPHLVSIDFWTLARDILDQEFGHSLWLAESADESFERHLNEEGIEHASEAELFRAFDLCYDYGTYDLFRGYHDGKVALAEYVDAQVTQFRSTPSGRGHARFLENHDHERAASFIPADRLAAWLAFTLFMPGAALMYAGQENGLTHAPSLFEPDPVSISPAPTESSRSPVTPGLVGELISLRRSIDSGGVDVSISGSVVTVEWGSGRRSRLRLDLAGGRETGEPHGGSPDGGFTRVRGLAPGVSLTTESTARI